MLNLSDKDLDRLSQEAAQQHEPGDIVGPKFWDKLEARLDRDLGKVNPSPARGIRRLPYYYAPAVLVLLSVTYYLVRLNNKSHKGTISGSPPLTMVQPVPAVPPKPTPSSQNPETSDKQNSTPTAPNTVQYPDAAGASAGSTNPAASVSRVNTPAPNTAATNTATSNTPKTPTSNTAAPNTPALRTPANATPAPGTTLAASPKTIAANPKINPSLTSTNLHPSKGRRHSQNATNTGFHGAATGKTGSANLTASASSPAARPTITPDATPDATSDATSAVAPTATPTAPRHRELTYSSPRGTARLTHGAHIDDSALRAFTLNSLQSPIRKGGLHINRSLQFGIFGGPDFASVNSVAGDRAGSSFGLTLDYQFADHWYIGSGLLFSRKVFASTPQNYHVPPNYYRQLLMGMDNVEYIKGSFNMLEIPLNLRYDFSTTGNTLFFASVGASSYLFTTQNCNYYYNFYNRGVASKEVSYDSKPNYLFSSLNLSLGVEAGISNSLSVVVAPYVKIPTGNIGFGQVQLNSFGIDFALHFAPVISRKR